jgi:hypothetical protein
MPSTADDRAPHTAAQTDVLMGQNAYFGSVGERGKHSLITGTCTNCHMELAPPPADLSYNLGGTNHAFGVSRAVCAECHGAFDSSALHDAVEAEPEERKVTIEQAILDVIKASIDSIAIEEVEAEQ